MFVTSKFPTEQIAVEDEVVDNGTKLTVCSLVQQRKMHVDRKWHDKLNNFVEFGTIAGSNGKKDNISNFPGIVFDEGNREEMVEQKLTKDSDLVELEKLKKQELGIVDPHGASKVSKGLRDEFDTNTYLLM